MTSKDSEEFWRKWDFKEKEEEIARQLGIKLNTLQKVRWDLQKKSNE